MNNKMTPELWAMAQERAEDLGVSLDELKEEALAILMERGLRDDLVTVGVAANADQAMRMRTVGSPLHEALRSLREAP